MSILGSIAKNLRKFEISVFAELIRKGGKAVTKEHAAARIAACTGCEYKGTVEPLPGMKIPGCEKCGCPFSTKPRMYNFFHPGELKLVLITCPHPQGNRWAEIDNNFLNQK